MSEVLVIGGGMAGAIAALKARERGARVVLARRSLGATAMSSGAIDVAPEPRAPGGDLLSQHIDPLEGAKWVARLRPHHPYAVLVEKLPRLGESLLFAAQRLGDVLGAPGQRNALLPTPLGTVKPSAMAQRSQWADVTALPEKVAVVEFAIIPDFDGRLVARGLETAAAALGRRSEVVVVASRFFHHVEDTLRLPHELAAALDEPAAVAGLAEDLKRALPAGVKLVLLPPVLGRHALDVAARLSALVGVPCLEVLSGPPSVPGLRLQDALDRALTTAGVTRLELEVDGRAAREGRYAMSDGRTVTPGAVVLATGKFLGGGILKRDRFVEPVLDLPVYSGARRLRDGYVGALLSGAFEDEQAAFHAGVRIDAELRPLGEDGAPALRHVFAAGSVIQGYDAATDKTGLGVAIFTGYLAGEAAAAVA